MYVVPIRLKPFSMLGMKIRYFSLFVTNVHGSHAPPTVLKSRSSANGWQPSFGKLSSYLSMTFTGPKPSGRNPAGSLLNLDGVNGKISDLRQPTDSSLLTTPSWSMSQSENPSLFPSK